MILFLVSSTMLAETTFVKIIVDSANLRTNPDVSSQIMRQIPLNTILESVQKEGEWYLVKLPPDEDGMIKSGYIHRNFIEEIKIDKEETITPPPQAKETQPTPVQLEAEHAGEPGMPAFPERLFSGFFLKFGWMFSPTAGGFSNEWIASLGYDFALHRNVSLGLEIQPAYRNFAELDMTVFPIMGFANLKAGVNLGSLTPSLSFASILAGLGAGLEAAYTSVKFEGDTYTDFNTNFAFHLLLGTELDLKSIALILEYQTARVSDPNVDPIAWQHFIMLGLRF
jgi:hypothetical protein